MIIKTPTNLATIHARYYYWSYEHQKLKGHLLSR